MVIFENGQWLPLAFFFLMGLSMLIYAVLDGYDLGVGVLMKHATSGEKDKMIASIGPFWDANETWLVLGVGLLLVAFPQAHGQILTNLYLPVAFMLIGLILRGVAFDFRVKAKAKYKSTWNTVFWLGSLLTSFCQGYMLGSYILGFEKTIPAFLFSVLIGICVVAGYCLIGACWLILKTEGTLQQKAVFWARFSFLGTLLGIALVSISTPLLSARIFEKWFSFPSFFYLLPIPLVTLFVTFLLHRSLQKASFEAEGCVISKEWVPFVLTLAVFVLCFIGLGYSFYPYIIPEQLLIVDAASAYDSLMIIFVGALIVLPILIGYTFIAYKVFHGKVKDLTYD